MANMAGRTNIGDKQVAVRVLKVARWVLETRGGRFTAGDLVVHFGLSKATAARYRSAWIKAFGTEAPRIGNVRRAPRTPPPQYDGPHVPAPAPKITLADLLKHA